MGIFGNNQKENEKAYGEGVKEGKEAGFLDQFAHSLSDAIPLPSSERDDSRDAGWHDGVAKK